MSYVLDTNVISELMRPEPNAETRAWVNAQNEETLFLTAINAAEIRIGIDVLPAGRRRRELAFRFEQGVLPLFADRILPFDSAASVALAKGVAQTRRAGRSVGAFDALIAAIATSRGFDVVTRDTAPFHAFGVPTINPWEPDAS